MRRESRKRPQHRTPRQKCKLSQKCTQPAHHQQAGIRVHGKISPGRQLLGTKTKDGNVDGNTYIHFSNVQGSSLATSVSFAPCEERPPLLSARCLGAIPAICRQSVPPFLFCCAVSPRSWQPTGNHDGGCRNINPADRPKHIACNTPRLLLAQGDFSSILTIPEMCSLVLWEIK